MFNNKINLLKALGIMLIVSGHLEFSLIPMFPPYSFHIALFFFISGYLFNEKYLTDITGFLARKTKSMLVPYYLYTAFYFVVTIIIAKLTGKFWGMPVTFKNYILTPFLNSHQLDLSCPLWFVTQLFISLTMFVFIFGKLKQTKTNKLVHFCVFLTLAVLSTFLTNYRFDELMLVVIRTMFSMFFIYLGYFYKNCIEEKINILNSKWLLGVIAIQCIFWLTNKDYTPQDGIGLSYILVWGEFDTPIIPVLTSLTGIWISLFIIEMLYPFVKDNTFLRQMGQNTYHIMANHLFIMYLITSIFLYINNIPVSIREEHDIYWIYNPLKNTYFYFLITMILSTYSGVFLKYVNEKLCLKKINDRI